MRLFTKNKMLIACLGLSIFAINPAFADKPEWAGNKHEKKMQKEKKRGYEQGKPYFTDHHRTSVTNYYGKSYRAGKCPPGLAKKQNGCLPPGQAKKWELQKPLPRGVVYYSLPLSVVVKMGQPPSGYRYVRVGSDILLMAIGTRMVVDAITDLTH